MLYFDKEITVIKDSYDFIDSWDNLITCIFKSNKTKLFKYVTIKK